MNYKGFSILERYGNYIVIVSPGCEYCETSLAAAQNSVDELITRRKKQIFAAA